MLCEGSGLRSVSRLTGVSINTVSKLLVDAGKACAEYHDKAVRNVKSNFVPSPVLPQGTEFPSTAGFLEMTGRHSALLFLVGRF
jgi:hypothetical protein